jgi:hypothetical protein
MSMLDPELPAIRLIMQLKGTRTKTRCRRASSTNTNRVSLKSGFATRNLTDCKYRYLEACQTSGKLVIEPVIQNSKGEHE